ncbi:MAG: HRDC domain-containing protein, partial [Fibrobacter sp.]|nr:HRDC domain-containing protein [Fibrobacter sp.]
DIITLRKFVNDSGQRDINSEKLDRMQEYAESQVCRRRILLNYFGENNSSNCGNCDICKHPPQRFNGTILVQKALSAIKRTGEHIGFSMTADILKGTLSDEIVQKGYDKLKTFGAGNKTTLKHWHDYLLQMLQLGYIEIAYNENNHLKITESGNEVLFGKKTAELAVAPKTEAKEDAKPRSGRATFNRGGNSRTTFTHTADDAEDNSLFETLRKVRRQIADENNWPAYVVLSDRTLRDLAYKAPTSINELQDVFGFGEMKIRKFGQQFVDAIRDYIKQ